MLVKFHSSTSGEIMMFAENARQLVEVLGKEPLARGVVTREQMPESIARLERAIARANDAGAATDDGEDGLTVGLAQRLQPFLELLRRTEDDEGYLLWEAPGDFGSTP